MLSRLRLAGQTGVLVKGPHEPILDGPALSESHRVGNSSQLEMETVERGECQNCV